MSVKRFDCTSDKNACGVMEQYSLGDWVSFDDYEKLEAELAAAKTLAGVLLAENQRLREAIREQIDGYRDDGMFDDLYLEAILEGSKP